MNPVGRGGGEQPLTDRRLRRIDRHLRLGGGAESVMNRAAEPVALRLLAVAAVVVLAGCTMCPDPYDYSGPVPNGSSPQNDFRARSNGILPLGAAPRPWPPIVRNATGAGGVEGLARRVGTPTPAPDAVAVALAETPDEPVEAVSVLVVVGGEDPQDAPPQSRDPWPVVPDFGSGPEVDAPQAPATAPPAASTEATVDVPAVTVVVPILTETPGWRQRTSR